MYIPIPSLLIVLAIYGTFYWITKKQKEEERFQQREQERLRELNNHG